jgi:glycosyltransferase involved in cell wall biosynthesis
LFQGKPRIAVVRGLGLKPAETRLYQNLTDFETVQIGARQSGSETGGEGPFHGNVVYLELKPRYLLDPVAIVRGRYDLSSWTDLTGLRALVKSFDLVNTGDPWWFFSGQVARICAEFEKPLVTVVWETLPKTVFELFPPYASNARSVDRATSAYIAMTKRAQERFREHGGVGTAVYQVYPGVDLEEFKPGPLSNHDVKTILFLGRPTAEKGIFDLVQAFRILNKQMKNIELLIVGSGPAMDAVNRILPRNSRLLGHVPHSSIPEILAGADVFCMPSRMRYLLRVPIWEEQFGYGAVEAMASGLPVVGTQTGALPEVLGPHNFIAEPGNPVVLAAALRHLLSDENLRIELGKANRRRTEQLFDVRKQGDQISKVMMKVIE